MPSSGVAATLVYVSEQISIYFGLTVFIAGCIGGLLNIIVFLSLKTFREKSSAFYLIVMSFVNIGDLMTGLLSRVLISGFEIDWTSSSSFYCKFRWYILQFCFLTSFTCTCLAAIDQYFSTCPYARLRQWSNIKTARLLSIIFIILWILHGIPFLIYFDIGRSPVTGASICQAYNLTFRRYHSYGFITLLACFLPLVISGVFGLAARYNIKHLAHRTIPIVQRYSEKQLTKMVLNQLLYNFIFTLPYTVWTILTAFMVNIQDPTIIAQFDFANVICMLLYYVSFACPFYVYLFASERFRKQLKHVLFEIHLKQRQQNPMVINQVAPESQQSS